jgi:hypothetical protein
MFCFIRLQLSWSTHRVTCILILLHVTLQGFVVGSDGGTLFLFERDGEGAARTYRKTKTLAIQGQPVKIRNLAVSPTEDTLLCTLENNQMYSLNLTNTELMKVSSLSCALLCHAVLCITLCHTVLCITLSHAVLCITLCHAVLYITLRYVVLRHAVLCNGPAVGPSSVRMLATQMFVIACQHNDMAIDSC